MFHYHLRLLYFTMSYTCRFQTFLIYDNSIEYNNNRYASRSIKQMSSSKLVISLRKSKTASTGRNISILYRYISSLTGRSTHENFSSPTIRDQNEKIVTRSWFILCWRKLPNFRLFFSFSFSFQSRVSDVNFRVNSCNRSYFR